MIFITYKTTEFKELKKHSSDKKYKDINEYLRPISIVKERIDSKSASKVISTVNDDYEQIYYDPVEESFSYDNALDFTDFWSKLFSTINEKALSAVEAKKVKNFTHNKLIIVNQNEILGQWQSIEVLSAIRHGAHVFWISVDKFAEVVKKASSKNNNKGGGTDNIKTLFVNELRKECKAIFPSKHEKL